MLIQELVSAMLCVSPWEACPFLNGDGGGVDGKMAEGKGEGTGGEDRG